MSAVMDLLHALIERVDMPDTDRADLFGLLGSIDTGAVDLFQLDEKITDHQSELDDGADGITFTTVRRSRPSSVFLAWEGIRGVSGHGYYELQFSTTSSTAGLVYTAQQQSTWHITDALAFGTTYYVRGRAVDAAGHEGAWGAWQSLSSLQTVTDDYADESVTAVKIGVLTADDVIVGANASDTSGVIRSNNFAAGSAGWRIRGNGDAEFNNVTVRGTINATAGDISGDLTVSGSLELTGTGHIRTGTGNTYIGLDGGSAATMSFVEANVTYGRIFTDAPVSAQHLFVDATNDLNLEAGNVVLITANLLTCSIGGVTVTINDDASSNASIGLTGTGGRVKFLTASNTVQIRNGGDTDYATLHCGTLEQGRGGGGLGFFGATNTSKRTVTGSRGGNAALQSLLTALAAYGLITDSTT